MEEEREKMRQEIRDKVGNVFRLNQFVNKQEYYKSFIFHKQYKQYILHQICLNP